MASRIFLSFKRKWLGYILKINFKEISRYVFVGVIATGIHYGIYFLLLKVALPQIAYTVGYLVSFFFNFYMSNHFTFQSKPTFIKAIGFALSHLINYILHILLLSLFLYLGLSKALAPIPVFMIVIPVNFLLIRKVLKSNKL